MALLHGPADPDAYRVRVGRYGDRWYHDPLPTCALAPPCDDSWPSVSIVKNAYPKFLTTWAANECAAYAMDHLDTLKTLDRAAGLALVSKAHERSRDGAAARGTAVHALLEALTLGQDTTLAAVEAGDWADAAHLFMRETKPEFVLSEAVVLNRTLGYGGTLDAIMRIDGKTYIVDFKSRKPGKHGAYDDEGAQLGAYASAEYAIIAENGRARRMALPPLDGGLIVSITPEGYRLYPVELSDANALFHDLRVFWSAMQECKPIGKPVHLFRGDTMKTDAAQLVATKTVANVPTPAPPTDDARRLALRARVQRVIDYGHGMTLAGWWPADVPTLKLDTHTSDQLDTIDRLITRVEAHHSMPFDFDTAPASREQYDLIQGFAPDEQAALVDEAGKGHTLAAFTAEDTARLRELISGIDQLKVAFSFEGETPQLVTTSRP